MIGLLILVLGLFAGISRWMVLRAHSDYPPQGRFLCIEGYNYHYKIAGEGRPVVLLHGTGGSLEDYQYGVFEALAKDFKVIAIDRPGHGHSQRPRGDAGAPTRQAEIIHQILNHLEIDGALIVAHSWSASLAMAYALAYPAGTLGLVLLQGTVFPQASVSGIMLRLLRLPLLGHFLAWLIVPWAGRRAIQRTLERAFSPALAPDGYIPRAQAMWTRPGQARAIAIDARRRDETIEAIGARYCEVQAPISFVVGASDRFIDQSNQGLRLHRQMPSASLEILPGAGHQIPQSNPQAVVDAVVKMSERTTQTDGCAPPHLPHPIP